MCARFKSASAAACEARGGPVILSSPKCIRAPQVPSVGEVVFVRSCSIVPHTSMSSTVWRRGIPPSREPPRGVQVEAFARGVAVVLSIKSKTPPTGAADVASGEAASACGAGEECVRQDVIVVREELEHESASPVLYPPIYLEEAAGRRAFQSGLAGVPLAALYGDELFAIRT